MRNYLLDIVKHSVSLDFENLRIDGTDTLTEISATGKDQLIVLNGRLHNPLPEFKGTFGIPNIALLNKIVNIPEYADEQAQFTTKTDTREGEVVPVALKLVNKTGDFKNEFRLMSKKIITATSPKHEFLVKSWLCEFAPSTISQTRLRHMTTALPNEDRVTFNIRDGNVVVKFGDDSSNTGSYMFHNSVDPNIKKTLTLPVSVVNSVFSLAGDKLIHIGQVGMMISVDSGLATYDYVIPEIS